MEMSTVCQGNKEKKRIPIFVLRMASKYYFVIELLRIALFSPPSFFSESQFCGWIPRLRPDIVFSPRVKAAESGRGGVGGGV